ncbi:MAG: hypothetical protein IBX68_10660 [Dehalococcoidia bacterium]|nr:hypothetical protein [Dehalococcoidia bacterium]
MKRNRIPRILGLSVFLLSLVLLASVPAGAVALPADHEMATGPDSSLTLYDGIFAAQAEMLYLREADEEKPDQARSQNIFAFHLYGKVQVDGSDAPDGTVITAIIKGDTFTTTTPSPYGASTYMLSISGDFEGALATFRIGDRKAEQTVVLEAGGRIRLDLSTGVAPAVVRIEDKVLTVGERTSAGVWVIYPDDLIGLGSYALRIDFDRSLLRVTGVSPGEAPFDALEYEIGRDHVFITQASSAKPGPVGAIKVANIEYRCLGVGSSSLSASIVVLVNANGEVTPATALDGTVTQVPAPSPTPANGPSPTPSITPAPPPKPGETVFSLDGYICTIGFILEELNLVLPDGSAGLHLLGGTRALSPERRPLGEIRVMPTEEVPDSPADFVEVGPAYVFGPDGATFHPPIGISLRYSPDSLPDRMFEEFLFIAVHDTETGQWIDLESAVDTGKDTVIAETGHFSLAAVMARYPPASFSVRNLKVPGEVIAGDPLRVSFEVINSGYLVGTYLAELKVNGVIEATKQVTVAGRSSTMVVFSISRDSPGSYEVELGGLTGRFDVSGRAQAGLAWSLIGAVIAATSLVALGIYFRRSHKPTDPA